MSTTNPLDIIKRIDFKQNVTIRITDEITGQLIQEHVGHNAATNSLLTGIAHYLLGDGVLNQGTDTLSSWVPKYISLGTMGLTSQNTETIAEGTNQITLPTGLGYTPEAPESATEQEKELNAVLRYTEYLNQTPGFGADGYDSNTNNDREWFGLGYPYSDKPDNLKQDFYTYDGSNTVFPLTSIPILSDEDEPTFITIVVYPDKVINQDYNNTSVQREFLTDTMYSYDSIRNELSITSLTDKPVGTRIAVTYTVDSSEAANCELIDINTLRSKITYRNLIPEVESEIPNTIDVILSAFISTGQLSQFRGDKDYIYITEAGLWSEPAFSNSGDNGLLAGYRLMPTDDDVGTIPVLDSFECTATSDQFVLTNNLVNTPRSVYYILNNETTVLTTSQYYYDIQTNSINFNNALGSTMPSPPAGSVLYVDYLTGNSNSSWKDMSVLANRRKVQKSLIRIGKGQVAQIIWKLQLGGLEQLNGLRYLYPSQYPDEVWSLWTSN